MSYTLAVATAAMSAAQFLNGRKLRRYQKNLLRLEAYAMTTEELPVSNTKFWLGKGFDWTQIHTQRTFECQRQGEQKYIKQSDLYKKARNLERYAKKHHNLKLISNITHSQHLISGKKFGKKLVKMVSKSPALKPLAMLSRKIQLINLLLNPVAPLPPVDGQPYLHGVGADEETAIRSF